MPKCAMVNFRRKEFLVCDEDNLQDQLISLAYCEEDSLFYTKGSFKEFNGRKIDVYDAVLQHCKKEKFTDILKNCTVVKLPR